MALSITVTGELVDGKPEYKAEGKIANILVKGSGKTLRQALHYFANSADAIVLENIEWLR